MLIGQDLETLQRLLGVQDIPEKYVQEYEIRKHLHDLRDSGPLGTVAIIDLLRFCKYEPPPKIKVEQEIDWRSVKKGTRVECIVRQEWTPGEFLGFGELGVLHVQLDHKDWVTEFPRKLVRIAQDQTKPKIEKVKAPKEILPPLKLKPNEIPGVYAHEYQDLGFKAGDNVWVDLAAAGLGTDIADAKFVSAEGDNAVVNALGQVYTLPLLYVYSAAPAAV